jgi:hypothetical protein
VDQLREWAEEAREALNKAVDDNLATISTLPPENEVMMMVMMMVMVMKRSC